MLRDNLVGLIEPMPTARENDGSSLALSIHKQRQASDDRSSCLKNPRPAGAESSLTERTTSPFQTEPRQQELPLWNRKRINYHRIMGERVQIPCGFAGRKRRPPALLVCHRHEGWCCQAHTGRWATDVQRIAYHSFRLQQICERHGHSQG